MHEKLNWICVGFPEWTAQFCVWKTTGKDNSEACDVACQNWAVCSVFLSGMLSHSKIAQFNWECTAPLTVDCRVICRQIVWLVGQNIQLWTGRWSIFCSHHFIYLQTICCARKVNLDRNTWGDGSTFGFALLPKGRNCIG